MASLIADEELRLEPVTVDHGPALLTAVRASLPELAAWMPWAHPDYGRPDVDAYLRLVDTGQERAHAVVSRRDGQLLGTCALNRVDQLNRTANLGYWVRTDATGRGVATRASATLLRYAFGQLDLERVEVVAAVDNHRSCAVPRRLGLAEEGRRARCLRVRGRQHDARVFVALRGAPWVPATP